MQLAVNVSPRQFRQADFVYSVMRIVRETAIEPGHLKLELTESLVLDDIEDTVVKMHALRDFGVHFAMDDFGTGNSSLSNLRKLPIAQLKIDQSFVGDILHDTDDAVIVQTIIAMAKNLGMEVIAEGVETGGSVPFLSSTVAMRFKVICSVSRCRSPISRPCCTAVCRLFSGAAGRCRISENGQIAT